MRDALQSTIYCDCAHPDIQSIAVSLKEDEEDSVAIAMRTFYFVRDNISFGFDLFQRKASDTLKKRYGACWNKSLLLVALLRHNQIPAQLGSIPLKRSFIKPAIGYWHRLANNPYNHCRVHAYIKSSWTILDPVLDKVSYNTFFFPLGVKWEIDWNGKDDVCLYTESISGFPIIYKDIDSILEKKVNNIELPKPLALIWNWYVNRRMWKVKKKIKLNNLSTNLSKEE
jgi:transglutaminase-like putative cysteine protease